MMACLLSALRAEAAGALSGVAEWRYGKYATEEGDESFEAAGFAQRYSLLHKSSGLIQGGRAGKYDLDLGAEWGSLEAEIGDEEVNVDQFKVLYRGDLLLAPGGLPFRLHLYSHDLANATFLEDSHPALSGDRSILTPRLISDLYTGQHIRTGATLTVGIRNGSYMGEYRDILSRFPRLLVDYKEDYIRNLDSKSPQHYRTRNLAFVSLNKKDNWFHYRYLDYTDFQNSDENYLEKVYMLGTVDHTLQRQWINLTNWIKVSVDGSFTTTIRVERDEAPEERYDLNFFARAARPGWNASTFSTFSRRTEEENVAKKLEIPFYLSREVDRNTSWRFRLVGSRDRQDTLQIRSEDEDVLFASARLESGKQRPFIVAPELSVEMKSGDLGEGYAAKAFVEAYSNNRYHPPVQWYGSYALSRFQGTGRSGVDVASWEQQLTGKVERDFSPRLRLGTSEDFTYGTGTVDRTVSRHIVPNGDQGLLLSSDNAVQRRGDFFRTTTTLYGEHRTANRLQNRVEMTYDGISDDRGYGDQFILGHSLLYDGFTLRFDMRNRLTFGDSLANNGVRTSNDLQTPASASSVDTTFEHYSSFRYSPGRIWETSVANEVDWRGGPDGSTTRWLGRQTYLYNFFTSGGFIRKLADLGEELEYERFTDITDEPRSLATFTLLGNVYPTRYALLGAKIRYREYDPEDYNEIAYFLHAGLNFRKFTVALDYGYGTREAKDTTAKRKEHRWDVQVRKTF